jgi:hypothetical protein
MALRAPGFAAALALLAVAGPAAAQEVEMTAGDEIAAIRELALYARYREAIEAVDPFLARTDLTAEQRNGALEVKAIVHLAIREQRPAQETLELLYRRDPGHRLSDADASPVVVSAFARARERAGEPIAVGLDHEVPAAMIERAAPVVTVRVGEGRDAVHEVRVGYRHAAGDRFAEQVTAPDEGGAVTARIPPPGGEEGYTLQYYVEALAPSGHVLARAGSSGEPLSIVVPAAPQRREVAVLESAGPIDEEEEEGGRSVASRWWFWTLLVAAIGGGVTAAVLLTRPDGPQSGSLGNVRFPLR